MPKARAVYCRLVTFLACLLYSNTLVAASELEPVSLQLKWFHQYQFAGYYAAKEKGFFTEEGLDVTLHQRNLSTSHIEDVLEGKAEYGVADAGLVLTRLQGKPVVLLSQIFQHSPLVLLALKDSGIRTPYDLAGKTIMADLKGNSEAPLYAMLLKTLGGLDSVTIKPHTFRNEDLLEGKIDTMDGYLTDQPYWFEQQGRPVTVIDPRDHGIDFYGDNLFTTEGEISKHPERVEKMIRAVNRGWTYALAHPEEIVDLILEKYDTRKLSRDHLLFEAAQTKNIILPQFIEIGTYEPSRFNKMAQTYALLGIAAQTKVDKNFFHVDTGRERIDLTAQERNWLNQHPVIRVQNEVDSAPYNFNDGNPKGYSIDYMNLLADKLGIQIKYITGPSWNEFIDDIKKSELDVIANIVNTPERRKHILFTKPYQRLLQGIYVKSGGTDFRSLEELDGHRVAVVMGSNHQELLEEKYPEIELVLVENNLGAIEAVLSNQAVATITDPGFINFFIKQHLVGGIELSAIINEPDFELNVSLGVRKDWPLFESILNKAMLAVQQDELSELREKWFLNLKDSTRLISLTDREKNWLKENPTITVSNESDYPPYSFNFGSRPEGYSIDYIRLLADRVGLELEFITDRTWDDYLQMIRNNELDVIAGIVNTVERQEFVEFTGGYIENRNGIYSQPGATYRTLNDLDGKSLAFVRGYAWPKLLKKYYPNIKLNYVDTFFEAVEAVITGEADATISDVNVIEYYIDKYSLVGIEQSGSIVDERFVSILSIGVSKKQQLLRGILDKAIETVSYDEEQALREKWFGKYSDSPALILTAEEKAWLKEHPTIRVYNHKNWPPFNFFEDDTPQGLCIDLMNVLAKKLGVTVDYVTGPPWHEALGMIREKNLDVMANIGETPDRKPDFLFTPSYLRTPLGIVSMSGTSFDRIDDLFGKTLALPKGLKYLEIIANKYPQINLLATNTALDSLKAVSFGQADAALGQVAALNYLIEKNFLSGLTVSAEFPLENVDLLEFHIGIRGDWPLLHSSLTKALASVDQEGMSSLRQKWLVEAEEIQRRVTLTTEERAWLEQHPTVRLGVDPAWPPFDFINEQGIHDGFSADVLALVKKKLGIDFQLVPDLTWSDAQARAKSRELDVLAMVSRTPERNTFLKWSRTILTVPWVFTVRDNFKPISSVEDLIGHQIVVPKGYAIVSYLRDNHPELAFSEVPTPLDGLIMVSSNKADVYIGYLGTIAYLIREHGLSHGLYNIKIAGETGFEVRELSIAVRSDWPQLVAIINKGLAAISRDELTSIQEKWMPRVQLEPGGVGARHESDFGGQVLKWMAALLVLFLGMLLVTWVLMGRPRELTIRQLLFIVSFIFAGLIVSIGGLITLLIDGEERLQTLERRSDDSLALATEIRQSSDDLTRFARLYVVTGDPAYEHYFDMIIAIRDGKLAHPRSSPRTYWDQVVAGLSEIDKRGETYSVEDRMREIGLSVEEHETLTKAKRESDDLIILEKIAMNAVKGKFQDDTGAFSVEGQPDIEKAKEMLHGDAYHAAKARIMKPIEMFFILLEERHALELNKARRYNQTIILGVTLLNLITIVFSIYVFFLLKRRIITPLAYLEEGAHIIQQGDYSHRLSLEQKDEAGALAQALNAMSASIDERTSRMRSLIDTAVDAIIVIDEDHIIKEFSPSAERVFGHAARDAVGQDVELIIPPDLRAAHKAGLRRVVEGGLPKLYNRTVQVPALHRDGRIFPTDFSVGGWQHGGRHFFVAIIRDISQRKKDEEDLLHAKEAAESATRSKSVFLANMSHEIRTPMNAILGYAQLMQHDKNLNAKQRANITTMDRSGKHLLELINDILEMSKIEAGRIEVNKTVFNLRDLVNDIIQMFTIRTQEIHLELHLDARFDAGEVIIQDESKIRQILINLLGNAVKFTQEGHITLRLQCSEVGQDDVAQKGDEPLLLTFEIEDTGVGIVAEEQSKVFGAFDQSEAGLNKEGGTGLGLAISREYARLMGGDLILVASAPGRGSLFRTTLPAQPGLEADILTAETFRTVDKLKPGQPEFLVLVVDDRLTNRDVIAQMLERVGFLVKTANNGKEGVRLFQQLKPACVLMDIRMPVMDGVEATRLIKSLPGGDEAVIIVVSASALNEEKHRALELGANAFIKKPIQEGELFEAIHHHLGVEYIYCDEDEMQTKPVTLNTAMLCRADVAQLSGSLQGELYYAAVVGNMKQLRKLIEDISRQDQNLGAALSKRLEKYDLPSLRRLFRPEED